MRSNKYKIYDKIKKIILPRHHPRVYVQS